MRCTVIALLKNQRLYEALGDNRTGGIYRMSEFIYKHSTMPCILARPNKGKATPWRCASLSMIKLLTQGLAAFTAPIRACQHHSSL